MTKSIFILAVTSLFLSDGCGQTNSPASKNNTPSEDAIKIKVGKAPGCVEVADLNNDKFPDLIVTNEQDSSVTILLGKGKAQFQEAKGSPFPAGNGVNDIAIGDFNKDGNPDLAFANHERQYLTVLWGNGQGNFAAAPNSPFPVMVKPHPHGIATGDFNNDGRLDLATDDWGNNEIEILFGDSIMGFKTPGTYFKVGKMPYQRLRAADVNGDHNIDIITTNLEGDNATVLLGDGNGSFNEAAGSPFPCGDSPFGLAIGDVNADGKPDLAIVNSPASTGGRTGVNGMTVLLGDGTGKFIMMKGSPYDAGEIPNRIAIGDVNGDGVNDIVLSDNNSNKITLFLMSKAGSVSSASVITVGNHPKGVAIADLDGDGKGDIVACNNTDDDILIIPGGKLDQRRVHEK
ncbi:MAG TPA: VCBS repeat-containing protein [Chitinophagales bacterium]|nr:VCBS repeat-containing protein [Chitinophagales bacterium]